jgi:hypothetical protein
MPVYTGWWRGAPQWSDGVVNYSNAHIDVVASVYVVHSGHSTQSESETSGEVRRILSEHLKEEGADEVHGEMASVARIRVKSPVCRMLMVALVFAFGVYFGEPLPAWIP